MLLYCKYLPQTGSSRSHVYAGAYLGGLAPDPLPLEVKKCANF